MMLKLNSWLFFLNVVLLSFCARVAADVKEINLSIVKKHNDEFSCMSNPTDTEIDVFKDRFRLHVNYGSSEINNEGRCRLQSQSLPQQFNYVTMRLVEKSDMNSYGSEIMNITSDLPDGRYENECVFYVKYAICGGYNGSECIVTPGNNMAVDKGVKCVTKFQIRKAEFPKTSSYMSVNNKKFYPSPENQEYRFYDGQGTTFTCHEAAGNAGDVELSHKLSKVKRISNNREKQTSPVSMYMKLGAVNDGDTLQCAFYYREQRQVVRLKLIVNKDTRGILAFAVNDLILPLVTENHYEYHYEYKYYIGEPLTVQMIKDNEMFGDEKCSLKGNNYGPEILRYYTDVQLISLDSFFKNKMATHTELHCTVLHYTDSKPFGIRLTFLKQTPDYTPFITGLSMSNVYLQYSNATENMIVYNIESKTLELYCSSNIGQTGSWNYSYDEVISTQDTNSVRSFRLQSGHNSTTIQCKDSFFYRTTFLMLFGANDAGNYRPISPQITTTLLPTTISTTFRPMPIPVTQSAANRSTTPVQDPSTTRPTSPLTEGLWVIMVGVLLVIFLLMVGLWIGYSYKKKRLPLNHSSNTNYQTLPDHQEGPMATPSQWDRPDDVTYADPNSFQNLYAKPTSKSNRNKTEPTYLNTQQMNNEAAHAPAQYDEPAYASVQHDEPAYAPAQYDEPAYASVQHDEPAYASVQRSDPAYASVERSDPICASVQRSEPTYAFVQRSDPTYASVQHKAPASTSEQKEEPTYANQIINEYQNIKTLNGANNKKTSFIGNNSKDFNRPYSKDHKEYKQSLDEQNSKNIKNANDANSKPMKMASTEKVPQNTYANLLKEFKGQKHEYVNVDDKNDVEPAY